MLELLLRKAKKDGSVKMTGQENRVNMEELSIPAWCSFAGLNL